jgi:hypothetical protein
LGGVDPWIGFWLFASVIQIGFYLIKPDKKHRSKQPEKTKTKKGNVSIHP